MCSNISCKYLLGVGNNIIHITFLFSSSDDKKKKKKGTCPEAPIQRVITDPFVPSFTDSQMCSRNSSNTGGFTLQQPRQPNDSPRSSTSSNSHHRHQPQTSSYHAEYYPSGYATEGEGAFEAQLLQRATRERPANLRMTAVRDYTPCCNEELAVRKGQRVKVLYRTHDWVFAITKHGQSGFLPFTYVRPSRKYAGYQSEPEITRVDDAYMSGYDTDVPTARPYPLTARRHFQCPEAPQTYSINTACRRTGSGSPIQTRIDFDSGYLSAFESSSNQYTTRTSSHSYRPTTIKPSIDSFSRSYLEELVVIHDFKAVDEDEVYVSKGERVKVLNADDPQWLWIASSITGKEGFIPRSCCALGNHPGKSVPLGGCVVCSDQ